ncbi:hypothetical protein [Priestia megaterium]|uniref:hypothetical protein n=1 Tax=Priestia megaterium TaxID=1404 RepID=UPI0012B8B033|nr:hypothetical protein [Priestia megaterium]
MTVESKIQTDYFKLYIDFEKDLDLSSLTKILNALENINRHICLENQIDYQNNKLKITDVYSGSLWFNFTTLQGIVCSLIATAISESLKVVGIRKRLNSKDKLNIFKKEISWIVETEMDSLTSNMSRDYLLGKEYENKLNIFLLSIEQQLAKLTIERLHPTHIKMVYYDILKEIKELKEKNPSLNKDVLDRLDKRIRSEFHESLVNTPKLINLPIKNRSDYDVYIENLLDRVEKLVDWNPSKEQEEQKEIVNYVQEPKSSQAAGDFILDVYKDKNIKECFIEVITTDGREIKLEIKERVPESSK